MGANQLARPQFEKKSWGAGGYENPNKPKMAAGGYLAAQDSATIPSGPFRPVAMGANGGYTSQGRYPQPPAKPFVPQPPAPQQRKEEKTPPSNQGDQTNRTNTLPPPPPPVQKPPAPQEQLPANQETVAQDRATSGTKAGMVTEYLSQKIWKVNGNKKVIDFNSKVVRANYTDYAHIHGFGGADRAANSTIGFVICDYSNGTGEGKSVTMKFNVDVEDIAILHQAAIGARMGTLRSPLMETSFKWLNTCVRLVEGWRKNFTVLEFFTKVLPGMVLPSFMGHEKARIIPRKALNALMATLMTAKAEMTAMAGAPVFSYVREKNNPYAKNKSTGFVPVSRIEINYCPTRKGGEISNYPWYIGITNFEAPMRTGKNGANTHISSEAVNKRSAFINLSQDDFLIAMTAIDRFLRVWELSVMGPVVRHATAQLEAAREEAKKNNNNSAR